MGLSHIGRGYPSYSRCVPDEVSTSAISSSNCYLGVGGILHEHRRRAKHHHLIAFKMIEGDISRVSPHTSPEIQSRDMTRLAPRGDHCAYLTTPITMPRVLGILRDLADLLSSRSLRRWPSIYPRFFIEKNREGSVRIWNLVIYHIRVVVLTRSTWPHISTILRRRVRKIIAHLLLYFAKDQRREMRRLAPW